MAIAIVDNPGFLVYYERMDDTQTGSVQVALDKAKTASMYHRLTKAFEDGIAKGRVALLGLTGATPIEGGVPIMTGGKVIGGVGVSGANSDQDAAAAMAGLVSLPPLSGPSVARGFATGLSGRPGPCRGIRSWS